jgi:hypothetical protein
LFFANSPINKFAIGYADVEILPWTVEERVVVKCCCCCTIVLADNVTKDDIDKYNMCLQLPDVTKDAMSKMHPVSGGAGGSHKSIPAAKRPK